ncbi:MAG: ribokinase, partial [Actinobacteria bacterium]|nr:ribokinase [Actinomycetota bacterium]
MGRVVVVGSLNIDLVTHVERHPKPGETVLGTGLERLAGGKGANQAVAASAAGATVVMVGCVGSDEAGSAYVTRLLALGIDVAAIRVAADCPTGHALITVDEAGENSIVVVAGANAAMAVDDLEVLESVGPGDIVLLQLEVPVEVVTAAVRRASVRGARVVLN